MEAGGRVSAPVICESPLARSLTFRSWRKLINGSVKLLAFKKCDQRTQAAVRLPFLGTGRQPLKSYHLSAFRPAVSLEVILLGKRFSASLTMWSKKAKEMEKLKASGSGKPWFTLLIGSLACLIFSEAVWGESGAGGEWPARLGWRI